MALYLTAIFGIAPGTGLQGGRREPVRGGNLGSCGRRGPPGDHGPPEPVICTADVTGEVTLFPAWNRPDRFPVPSGGPSAIPPGYTLVELVEHQGSASRVGASIVLWQSDQSGCPGGSLPGALVLSASPNQAFSTATIAFGLPGGGEARISAYDITGRLEGRIFIGSPAQAYTNCPGTRAGATEPPSLPGSTW